MTRVHFVKSARKEHPLSGGDSIKKGESYYWFKRRYGRKIVSRTRPKRWQLTGSSYLSWLWRLIDELPLSVDDFESFRDDLESLQDEIESVQDEAQESLENMPEHLQDSSDSGILLTERIERLEEARSELTSVDVAPVEELNNQLEKEREALAGIKRPILPDDPETKTAWRDAQERAENLEGEIEDALAALYEQVTDIISSLDE